MSDLIAELGNPPRKPNLSEWIAAQDAEVLAALHRAANDHRWSDTGLEQWFRGKGISVSIATVREWRAKHDAR